MMMRLTPTVAVTAILLADPTVFGDYGVYEPGYYPLAMGTTWHYRIDNGQRQFSAVYRISKIEDVDGLQLAQLDATSEGKELGSTKLTSNENGVFVQQLIFNQTDKPLLILRYPIKDQDSWRVETKTEGRPVTIVFRLTREQVKVPAGEYDTARVVADMNVDGTPSQVIKWYADRVGVVKQSLTIEDKTTVLELLKMTPGK